MMIFQTVLKRIVWLALLLKIARMYLDPSSGSFILQILIAGLLGGLLTIKLFWARIKAFITRTPATPPSESTDQRP